MWPFKKKTYTPESLSPPPKPKYHIWYSFDYEWEESKTSRKVFKIMLGGQTLGKAYTETDALDMLAFVQRNEKQEC